MSNEFPNNTPWEDEDEEYESSEVNTEEMVCALAERLTGDWTWSAGLDWESCEIRTFADAYLLTGDKGLLITLPSGQQFTITVARRN